MVVIRNAMGTDPNRPNFVQAQPTTSGSNGGIEYWASRALGYLTLAGAVVFCAVGLFIF